MIVSPTEPPELKAIAKVVSWLPEQYGADILINRTNPDDPSKPWLVGIQRKEYHDLLVSVNDGRLTKEIMQMNSLDYKILIIEGEVKWTTDGQMILDSRWGQGWSRSQWDGLCWSVRDREIWVLHTDSLHATISTCERLERWFEKSHHTSLGTRPGLGKGLWGQGPGHKEFSEWMMMGIPGIGPKAAERIVEMYGLPMQLKVGVEELMKVEGIGKVKAEQIVRLFEEPEESE